MSLNLYVIFKVLKSKKELFIREGWYFPRGSTVKNLLTNAGNSGDASLIPGLRRSLGGRKWQPTPVLLPKNSH